MWNTHRMHYLYIVKSNYLGIKNKVHIANTAFHGQFLYYQHDVMMILQVLWHLNIS